MKIKQTTENIAYTLRLVLKYAPGYLWGVVFQGIVNSVINTLISVFFVIRVFDAMERTASFGSIVSIVCIMAVLQVLNSLLQAKFNSKILPIQRSKLIVNLHTLLFNQAQNLDLACYDDPEFYNNFIMSLNEVENRTTNIIVGFGRLLSQVVSIFAISSILFSIEPLLVLVTVVSIIFSTVLQKQLNKINFERNLAMNPHIKENSYIVRLFYLREFAQELRLTNISTRAIDKFRKTMLNMNLTIEKHNVRFVIISAINTFVTSSIFDMGVMLLFAFRMMVRKSLSLGSYAAGINGVWQLKNNLSGIIECYSLFHDNSQYISKIREFLEYKNKIINTDDRTLDLTSAHSIALNNVSFSYSPHKKVLNNISIQISPGEKIAIVGPNGAGKTTLVKLLLRLYDPSNGNIKIDGVDLRKYEISNLHRSIGVVFQDYNLYATTLAENIAMDTVFETKALKSALYKSGFEHPEIELASEVTKEFSGDGIVFSGGEAQKIAISRVFAHQFHIYIMDEPSSALDSIAEYNFKKLLFEEFKNKTVVFTCHRLSTAQAADRIVVIENGEIVEIGSPSELMSSGGKFASMYKLQAEKYKM